MQRSIALKLAPDQSLIKQDGRLNANQPDNLFTDTGSPKYVNTSAILRQHPHKQRQQYHQYSNNDPNQNPNTISPGIGRRGLQQQEPPKDNFSAQVSKNLDNEFSKYGFDANNERNNRLLPVTTIQQVLYNNGNPNAMGIGAPLPQPGNSHVHGQSPLQPQHPILQTPNINNGVARSDVHHNNQRLPSGAGHNIGNNVVRNHNSSSSSTTSSSFIPSLQKSVENAENSRSGGDRIILERNLTKLIKHKVT
jgi:hypothetical protein